MSRTIPILLYHSISEEVSPEFGEWTLSPKVFAEQMSFLHEHEYRPITVTQLTSAMGSSHENLPDRPILLTFDDGFVDFYTDALPILKQHGFTATLYIPTGLIGISDHWLVQRSHKKTLSWAQIAEIDREGVECGSHSHSHPQLDTLPISCARKEISYSKKILEDHLGHPVLSFSYPHGYHSPSVRDLVQEAGYTSATAVKHAMSAISDDPFALSRIIIRSDSDAHKFKELLKGSGLPIAPRRERMRTKAWRVARRLSARLRGETSVLSR